MSYRCWLHQSIQQDFNVGYEWYDDKKVGLGMEFLTPAEKKIAAIVLQPETYSSKGIPVTEKLPLNAFPMLSFTGSINGRKKYSSVLYTT